MEFDIYGLRVFVEIPYRSLIILLVLFIGLTIAYWLMVQQRKKRVIKFGNFETLKKVEGKKRFSVSPVLFFIRAAVIILLFLVATESIQINMLRPVANANVIIAMDVSSTMMMPDYEPNRLEAAKIAAGNFMVEKLPEATKVGVITFSSQAALLLKPTNDVFKARDVVTSIQASPEAGTALADALRLSATILNETRPKKDKVVFVFTDGKNNIGSNMSDVIPFLKEQDVRVYVVGIGNNNKTLEIYYELIQIMNKTGQKYTSLNIPELDSVGLAEVTELTGGAFASISDKESLEKSLSEISVTNERVALNSEFYILLFITVFLIVELVVFSKYGAI
ncbi:VWA domain-containing protein [archaeon]|nr:VWA domain-containing protein [archaeon]